MKNIDDYDVYFSNELEKFLNKQNYIKVEDKIIGLLEDEARKIKEQFLSNYGVISGLYLIVFSCLCGKYYSISQTSTEVILTTIAFIILVFLLYQIIQGIKMISEMRYLSRNRLIIMMKENQIQRETNSNTNQIDDSFLTEKSVISKDNDSGLGCSEK
jgi:small-conductance mechanosensitive channel